MDRCDECGFEYDLAAAPAAGRSIVDGVAELADWVQCLSPVPAVMEVLGHGSVTSQGMDASAGAVPKYLILSVVTSLLFAVLTVARLKGAPLDRVDDRVNLRGKFLVDEGVERRIAGLLIERPPVVFVLHRWHVEQLVSFWI